MTCDFEMLVVFIGCLEYWYFIWTKSMPLKIAKCKFPSSHVYDFRDLFLNVKNDGTVTLRVDVGS